MPLQSRRPSPRWVAVGQHPVVRQQLQQPASLSVRCAAAAPATGQSVCLSCGGSSSNRPVRLSVVWQQLQQPTSPSVHRVAAAPATGQSVCPSCGSSSSNRPVRLSVVWQQLQQPASPSVRRVAAAPGISPFLVGTATSSRPRACPCPKTPGLSRQQASF